MCSYECLVLSVRRRERDETAFLTCNPIQTLSPPVTCNSCVHPSIVSGAISSAYSHLMCNVHLPMSCAALSGLPRTVRSRCAVASRARVYLHFLLLVPHNSHELLRYAVRRCPVHGLRNLTISRSFLEQHRTLHPKWLSIPMLASRFCRPPACFVPRGPSL